MCHRSTGPHARHRLTCESVSDILDSAGSRALSPESDGLCIAVKMDAGSFPMPFTRQYCSVQILTVGKRSYGIPSPGGRRNLISHLHNECRTLSVHRVSHTLEVRLDVPLAVDSWGSINTVKTCNSPLLKARLSRKGCQLQFVRPTGFVLGVQVIERLRNLHRIHHYLWPLLGHR